MKKNKIKSIILKVETTKTTTKKAVIWFFSIEIKFKSKMKSK